MENTLDSKTSSVSSDTSIAEHVKAASAPLVPGIKSSEAYNLKTQLSAPSYFYSLRENDAPPFRKPEREARPQLLIGTIMNNTEAIQMIAANDTDPDSGLRKFLGNFLVEKKVIANYHLSEKNFLISLLTETICYAAQRDFSAFKLSCLLTIYIKSHLYFKYYYYLSPAAVWYYFKEIMIRHTIEDSPDGQEVFEPDECYDIVTHFHTVYLSNLPLVHILTFGVHRLKFLWPFNPK